MDNRGVRGETDAGTRTGAVDLLDAGEVVVAGPVDAHLRPGPEHPQHPLHQPLRHRSAAAAASSSPAGFACSPLAGLITATPPDGPSSSAGRRLLPPAAK